MPSPEMEPGSPALQADSLPSEPPGKPSFQVYLGQLVKGKVGLPWWLRQ